MNDDPVRDPFASHRADLAAFLNSAAPTASGTMPIVRGGTRLYGAAHRAVSNVAADASAVTGSQAADAGVGDVVPVPDVLDAASVPAPPSEIGVDLSTLTVDQLANLMAACAAQMMRSASRVAGSSGP